MPKTPYDVLPDLFLAVRRDHEEAGMQAGHGFESHVNRVAALAGKFAASEWKLLAIAAGLCHNADRLLARRYNLGHRKEVPSGQIQDLVWRWLALSPFSNFESTIIVSAVLNHERPNDPMDHSVQIALQDADRVANASLDVVIRSGQFHPDLPVIDLSLLLGDKRGKYNGRLTVVADLVDCLDWAEPGQYGCRTKLGQEMIKDRVAKLRHFLEGYVRQLREEGVVE